MARAAETIYRGGGSLFDWRDPSGAGGTVTTLTVDNVVRCVAPTFTAGRPLTAVPPRVAGETHCPFCHPPVLGVGDDDGRVLHALSVRFEGGPTAGPTGFAGEPHCPFCNPLVLDVVDDDGRVLHALSVRLEDAATTRRRVVMGQPVTVAVAGFAERRNVWEDGDAYERAQEGRRATVPLGTVAPTGLYAPEPSPHAMVTGVVSATDERLNETTGLPFRWAAVTIDGGEIEVVMRPCDLEAGNVVQALCWMVGRVVDGLGDEPRGLAALLRTRTVR